MKDIAIKTNNGACLIITQCQYIDIQEKYIIDSQGNKISVIGDALLFEPRREDYQIHSDPFNRYEKPIKNLQSPQKQVH